MSLSLGAYPFNLRSPHGPIATNPWSQAELPGGNVRIGAAITNQDACTCALHISPCPARCSDILTPGFGRKKLQPLYLKRRRSSECKYDAADRQSSALTSDAER